MIDKSACAPERTAVRTALWRALHLLVDDAPHVFEDELGLRLVGPDEGWRERPDMHPKGSARARASIVARARWIEDRLRNLSERGVEQYVLLGAGLDTFALRNHDPASRMRVFEVDQPAPQEWKRRRCSELGIAPPAGILHHVPVDFDAGDSWWERLQESGFDPERPAFLASAGVAMYLGSEAITSLLRHAASLAPGSALVMSYMLPLDLVDADEQMDRRNTENFARMAGTPFRSLFAPDEIVALARACGFQDPQRISSAQLASLYFQSRTDGLRPSSSEEILFARI